MAILFKLLGWLSRRLHHRIAWLSNITWDYEMAHDERDIDDEGGA